MAIKGHCQENDTLIITDIARENEITKFQKNILSVLMILRLHILEH